MMEPSEELKRIRSQRLMRKGLALMSGTTLALVEEMLVSAYLLGARDSLESLRK